MLDNDSLILGLLLGLAVPFVGYALILTLFEQLAATEWLSSDTRTITFRARTMGVLAICLNIIPFRYYQKQWYQTTMRGVMIATLFYVGFWLFKFSSDIF